MKLQLAAALLASASLFSGCASDSPNGPLEDCETCDVDVSKLQAYQEIGLVCGMFADGIDLTCVGAVDVRNPGLTTFEGDLGALPAPSVLSDSTWVGPMTLQDSAISLTLGPDYQLGSSFALSVVDGSLYAPEANDWLPFDTVIGIKGASEASEEDAPVEDSWISNIVVPNAELLDPEMLVFPVTLPFERWQVQIFGVDANLDYELIYSVPGSDRSVRVPLRVDGGSILASLIAASGSQEIEVRLSDEGAPLRLTGPAALVVDYDDMDYPYLRLATDEDLSFGSLFD